MTLLTPKREAYVQNLIKGMSQREAYKTAFNASRMKDSTIDSNASRLLSDSKVAARFAELQAEVVKASSAAAVASATEVLEEITNIALGKKKYPAVDMFGNEYDNPVTVPNRVKALELLAKHHKLLTDNVSLTGTTPVQIINDIPKGDSNG